MFGFGCQAALAPRLARPRRRRRPLLVHMPLCRRVAAAGRAGGRVRVARGAPGAAAGAAAARARAPAAQRPAAGLRDAPQPRSRTLQVDPLREFRLDRHEQPQVVALGRRRLAVERQAAAVLREHELRGTDSR